MANRHTHMMGHIFDAGCFVLEVDMDDFVRPL